MGKSLRKMDRSSRGGRRVGHHTGPGGEGLEKSCAQVSKEAAVRKGWEVSTGLGPQEATGDVPAAGFGGKGRKVLGVKSLYFES